MSMIKSKDTKPELIIRKYIHGNGFRFRLYKKDMPGRPDIVMAKLKTVIFVNGCFWHGHSSCNRFKLPKTRTEWWNDKIQKNIARDQKNSIELKNNGWNIIVIWECELASKQKIDTLKNLLEKLNSIEQIIKAERSNICLKTNE